jgi:hypothetical protein
MGVKSHLVACRLTLIFIDIVLRRPGGLRLRLYLDLRP